MSRQFFKNAVSRSLLPLLFLITAVIMAVPARAQTVDARLSRIENEIQTLSRAVFRGEDIAAGSIATGEGVNDVAAANTELRLQQIERELRTLTGRVEEQNFESRQFQEEMDQRLAEMESRLSAMESQAQGTIPAAGPVTGPDTRGQDNGFGTESGSSDINTKSVPPVPQPGRLGTLRRPADQPLPEGTQVLGTTSVPAGAAMGPVDSYERAFALLRDSRFDEAQGAFSAFLEEYPRHDLAPNAKYWLGETYYVRNDFERAARVFAEAYQQFPDSSKGPDNLLKLGMSLAGLGKTDDACLTFSQLQKEYPAGAQPILMRAEQEMDKLGCRQY